MAYGLALRNFGSNVWMTPCNTHRLAGPWLKFSSSYADNAPTCFHA